MLALRYDVAGSAVWVDLIVAGPRLRGVHQPVAIVRQLVVVRGNEVPRDRAGHIAEHVVMVEQSTPAGAGLEVGREILTSPLRYGQRCTAVRRERVRIVPIVQTRQHVDEKCQQNGRRVEGDTIERDGATALKRGMTGGQAAGGECEWLTLRRVLRC